jgi:hypothetical protein
MSMVADEFSVGRVLAQTSSIYLRNFFSFIAIALIVTSPPYLLYWMLVPVQEMGGPYTTSPRLLVDVVYSLLEYIVTGVLVYGIVQALRGRQTGVDESIRRGLGAIWRVVGVAVAAFVVIGLGFLLIVPGLIFIAIYWVAVPATVIILFLFGALTAVLELVLPTLLVVVEPNWAANEILVESVANFIVGALGAPLIAAAAAISYFDLRTIKEGIDIDEIAAVFD